MQKWGSIEAYRFETLIRELHYGHWEGHLQTALAETDPEGVAGKARDPFGWRPRNGESYADLTERIKPRGSASLDRDLGTTTSASAASRAAQF